MAGLYEGADIVPFDFWGAPVLRREDGSLYCPGYIGETFSKNIYDVVYIAGAPTPGIAEVSCKKERAMDAKKPAGSDGARVTLHGLNLAEIQIQLLIWTPDQLQALNELWPILLTPAYKTVTTRKVGRPSTTTATISGGRVSTVTIPAAEKPNVSVTKQILKNPQTFDVSHPVLHTHGVKAIQIIGGEGPVPGPIAKTRMFIIRAIEYLPPKAKGNVTQTPVAAKGSTLDAEDYPTPGTNEANTGP